MWIGLNDIGQEGDFVWTNGMTLLKGTSSSSCSCQFCESPPTSGDVGWCNSKTAQCNYEYSEAPNSDWCQYYFSGGATGGTPSSYERWGMARPAVSTDDNCVQLQSIIVRYNTLQARSNSIVITILFCFD